MRVILLERPRLIARAFRSQSFRFAACRSAPAPPLSLLPGTMAPLALPAPPPILSKGDFVEIAAPHVDAGQRGYVLEPKANDPNRLRIVMSGFHQYNPSAPLGTPLRLCPESAPIQTVKRDLLKLVRQERMNTFTKVYPYTVMTHPCLGMAASPYHTESIIDALSAHGEFPRFAAIHLPDLPWRLASFKETPAEHIVKSLHRGQFIAFYSHMFGSDGSEESQWMLKTANPFIIIKVFVPVGHNQVLPAGTLFCKPHLDNGQVTMQYNWMCQYSTKEQGPWMMARVLHHLLRVTGCDFGCVSVWEFHRFLFKEYSKRASSVDLMDSTLMLADIMVQTKQSEVGCYFGLQAFCEVLEMMGQYPLSAPIHEQAAMEYATDPSHKRLFLAALHHQALAHQRAEEFDKAEAVFLQCLRELFTTYKQRGFDHEVFAKVKIDFPHVYLEQMRTVPRASSVEEVFYMYLLLAVTLAISDRSSVKNKKTMDDEPVEPILSLLAGGVRKTDAARKAFAKACLSSSVEDFQEALLSLKNPDEPMELLLAKYHATEKRKHEDEDEDEDDESAPATENDKDDSSSSSTTTTGPELSPLCCGNPFCEQLDAMSEIKLLHCARCRTERYCSKACQVAHWKEHKATCGGDVAPNK